MKSASEEELQRRRKGREGGYSLVHVSSGGCSAGLYHSVMAGHEIESEAGVCKKKKNIGDRVQRFFAAFAVAVA